MSRPLATRHCARALLIVLCLVVPISCQRSNADVTLDTSNWQPFSIGRADMRLPPGATVTYNHATVNEIDMRLRTIPPGASFDKLWEKRKAEIEATGPPQGRSSQIAYTREPGGAPATATVLYYQNSLSDSAYALEHWEQHGPYIYTGGTGASRNEVKLAETMMADAFRNLEPDAAPKTKEDFAIEHGVVHMIGENGAENTDVEISFPILDAQHSRVTKAKLTLSTDVKVGDGKPTLLARIRDGDEAAQAYHLQSTFFERGKRTVSGLDGEVAAYTLADAKMPLSNGFSAEWEYGGKANANSAPNTDILMSIDGVPQGADHNLLLAYWNALLASFHFR